MSRKAIVGAPWFGLSAAVVLFAAASGCGDDCKSNRDCPTGQYCAQGACRPFPDNGADGDADAPDVDLDRVEEIGPDADGDVTPPRCPDGACGDDESCVTCPEDCGTCPPPCGDGVCEPPETTETCAFDCPPVDCGDGDCCDEAARCVPLESGCTCISDCGECIPVCGDRFVSPGEECDDGNGVPGDGCEPITCTFTCREHAECPDDGNPCTREICGTDVRVCRSEVDPLANGRPCGGGDICTGFGTCLDGGCVFSTVPLDCDDGEPCTVDTCEPAGGTGCVHTELRVDAPCDDGLFCITGDRCRRGLDLLLHCFGDFGASPCNDGNPCTEDICVEETDSCRYEPPTYRVVECGVEMRGNTMGMPDTFRNLACPGGTRPAAGADTIEQVTVSGSGTLQVTIDRATSDPATTAYIVTNPCSPATSCLAAGGSADSASATVVAGTYYILIDTSAGGGPYRYSVTCP
ncbi:MAG: DUF4215 domain-containing protein [Myxococcota bacterium]|nr:DUF4215 domain-containing protein [Myxococcota bacterium]